MTVSETQCEAAKDKDCRDASPPSMPGKVIQADRDGANRVAAVRTAAAEKAAADMALLGGRVEQLEEKTEQLSETRDELRERAEKVGKLETEADEPAEVPDATAAEVPAALEELCKLAKETYELSKVGIEKEDSTADEAKGTTPDKLLKLPKRGLQQRRSSSLPSRSLQPSLLLLLKLLPRRKKVALTTKDRRNPRRAIMIILQLKKKPSLQSRT